MLLMPPPVTPLFLLLLLVIPLLCFSSISDPAFSFPILQGFFFRLFLHTLPHFCCFNFNPVSPFISFAWYKFIITMPFLFLCKFLNFYVFFFFLLFFFPFSPLPSSSLFSFSSYPSVKISSIFLVIFFFISQCEDFLNFPCHFLGAVLPAPALYPSLLVSFFRNWLKGLKLLELLNRLVKVLRRRSSGCTFDGHA